MKTRKRTRRVSRVLDTRAALAARLMMRGVPLVPRNRFSERTDMRVQAIVVEFNRRGLPIVRFIRNEKSKKGSSSKGKGQGKVSRKEAEEVRNTRTDKEKASTQGEGIAARIKARGERDTSKARTPRARRRTSPA